jgi:FkbM family methyltransferase
MPWLESFRPGETLVDIGAGIGLHAVYAAVFTGCRVFAFEPESLSYAELNKNIFVNDLNDRVSAFCMALTGEVKIGFLDLDTFRVSHSHADFSKHTPVPDVNGHAGSTDTRNQGLRQACISSTLDTLVEAGIVPAPNHIMIEVPGANFEVLAGCRRALEDSALRSVLLEIDFRSIDSESVLDMMTRLGWKYSMDQLRVNPNFILPPELIHTLRREKRDRMNFIFFRDDRYVRLFQDFLMDYQPPRPFPNEKVANLVRHGRMS